MRTSYKAIFVIVIVSLISACANHSHQQALHSTLLKNSSIESAHFKHRIVFIEQEFKPSEIDYKDTSQHDQQLNIFIEGDGTPWFKERYVKKDPSPRTLLMFNAMQKIEGNTLYIGRPCYFQTEDPNCHYRYWTSDRYASEVIQSMKEVLEKYINNYHHIVFIGHSGGGTIATLLACEQQAPQIKSTSLITMSANLDTDKWTDHHDWSRMNGSLNPTRAIEDCSHVSQYHYVGEKDLNVPYTLNQYFFEQHHISPIIFEEADHTNWLDFWPDIIKSNPKLK